jgi:hypothetical protein
MQFLIYATVPGIPLDSVVALSQEPVIDLLEIDVELGEFNVRAFLSASATPTATNAQTNTEAQAQRQS